MNKHVFTSAPPHRDCRGFSLFEVLITVVVVSIGLLGLAGMQFAGLRASNQAQDHTIASHLAQDVVERIRANQAGAGFYIGANITAGSSATNPNCSGPGGCGPQQMVNFDLFQLWQLIDASGTPVLPNASIDITANAGTNRVTVIWGERGPAQTLVLNY